MKVFFCFSQWKESNQDIVNNSKNSTINLNIGSLLIGWLIELNLLKNKVIVLSRKEKHNILVVGSQIEVILPKDNITLFT